MQIFYYQRRDQTPNFGDELNTWLWQQLLPDVLNQANDEAVLVGLGTLLNDALPQRLGNARQVHIFTTGAGYERPLTKIPAHWRVHCVRGPLSARVLGLSPAQAIADGGILLLRLIQDRPEPIHRAGFMPHVHHATFAAAQWTQICQAAGITYIDPRWPVARVIRDIQTCQMLIAEAMHGAIAADALGIPWLPVVTSPRILSFKWQDWCASIRQPYQPVHLPPLAEYPPYGRGMRSGLRALGHWSKTLLQPPWPSPFAAQPEQTAIALGHIMNRGRPILSDRPHLENLTQALEHKLEDLRQDRG